MSDERSFKGPFLFINKDAKNLKSQTTEETFAIGSHVSGSYTKWAKVTRQHQPHDTQPTESTLSGSPSGEKSGSPRNVRTTKGTRKAPPTTRERKKATLTHRWRVGPSPRSRATLLGVRERLIESDLTAVTGEDTDEQFVQLSKRALNANTSPCEGPVSLPATSREHSREPSQAFHPSPRTALQKGNSDPFSAAVVAITPFHNYLINIWKGVYLQTVWPTGTNRASDTGALIAWRNDSRDLIESETRFQSLLAWTLMLKAGSLQESHARTRALFEAQVRKTKSMELLRRDLSQNTPGIILVPVIWHLAGTELYAGNVSDAMVHFHALKDVVNSIGGLQVLPWYTQKLVIVADMTLSQVRMKRPLFPVDQWNPGSIRSTFSLFEAEIFSLIPHMVEPLHIEVPRNAVDIFADYRELLAVHDLANVVSEEHRRTELLCWSQLRQYALSVKVTNRRIDLADTAANGHVSGTAAECALEDCACLGVDYFLQIIWNSHHSSRTAHVPFHHPQAGWDRYLEENSLSHPHLALWVLFIAATVEEIMSFRAQIERVNYQKFMDLTVMLGLWSPVEVRSVLTQFLYHGKSLDEYLYALFARRNRSLDTLEAII